MRGFKVVRVSGERKVEKEYSICEMYIKVVTRFHVPEGSLEIWETMPAEVGMFRNVLVKRKNLVASSMKRGKCFKKVGVYLDGEKVGERLLSKGDPIKDFLAGKSIYIARVGMSVNLIEFPSGKVKKFEMDELFDLGMEILGKEEFFRLIKEVVL